MALTLYPKPGPNTNEPQQGTLDSPFPAREVASYTMIFIGNKLGAFMWIISESQAQSR